MLHLPDLSLMDVPLSFLGLWEPYQESKLRTRQAMHSPSFFSYPLLPKLVSFWEEETIRTSVPTIGFSGREAPGIAWEGQDTKELLVGHWSQGQANSLASHQAPPFQS